MNVQILTILLTCFSVAAMAQQTRVIPWQPATNDAVARAHVYHPEPLLLVHGVNANDSGWESVTTPTLAPEFSHYDLPFTATSLTGWRTNTVEGSLRAFQHNFLHTFNYGDPPGTNTHNRQSYEHIEWNAWENDKNTTDFFNIFTGHTDIAPGVGDLRKTLDVRITDLRTAYRSNPNDPDSAPELVVMTHSLGALLCHYYMLKSDPDTGVRRLVTLAGAHQGTHLANWLLWYMRISPEDRIRDGRRAGWLARQFRKALPDHPATAGFFVHHELGAVRKAVLQDRQAGGIFRWYNSLLDYFWDNPAPKIEYVFNSYQLPPVGSDYLYLRLAIEDEGVDPVFLLGDGFVPIRSAEGKNSATSPSIWNGLNNPNGDHDIDPVIFGVWYNTDHTGAVERHIGSQLRSLFGVPYRWPGATTNDWPRYAQRFGENQSFSKYFPAPSDGSIAYTDEPGIAALHLLYDHDAGPNPFLIPSLNTWTTNNAPPQKTATNIVDFVGHQIIGGPLAAVHIRGTVGAKNRSQFPVATSGTNYWVVAGNEYLPAGIQLQTTLANAPVAELTSNFLPAISNLVAHCLVEFDGDGNPQHQYGLFGNVIAGITNQQFVAVQGQNIGGLLTPQAERAFDVPVVSSNVVSILRGINLREAMQTNCHAATTPTRWTARVEEWVDVNTNTLQFALNFFPTNFPSVAVHNIVRDAWTGTSYADWTFIETNKTVVITNAATASSQFLVSYDAFLGTATVFTNAYTGSVTDFFVPALADDTLAGVPVTTNFLGNIRASLDAIIPKYKTNITDCVPWTKTNLLARLHPTQQPPPADWLDVGNGLITAAHFQELEAALDLLSLPDDCSCPGQPVCGIAITEQCKMLRPATVTLTVAQGTTLCDGETSIAGQYTLTHAGSLCDDNPTWVYSDPQGAFDIYVVRDENHLDCGGLDNWRYCVVDTDALCGAPGYCDEDTPCVAAEAYIGDTGLKNIGINVTLDDGSTLTADTPIPDGCPNCFMEPEPGNQCPCCINDQMPQAFHVALDLAPCGSCDAGQGGKLIAGLQVDTAAFDITHTDVCQYGDVLVGQAIVHEWYWTCGEGEPDIVYEGDIRFRFRFNAGGEQRCVEASLWLVDEGGEQLVALGFWTLDLGEVPCHSAFTFCGSCGPTNNCDGTFQLDNLFQDTSSVIVTPCGQEP
jgi:hypothetical protein